MGSRGLLARLAASQEKAGERWAGLPLFDEQFLQHLPVESHQQGVFEMEKRGAEVAGRSPDVVETGPHAWHLDGFAAAADNDFFYRSQKGLDTGIVQGGSSGRALGFQSEASRIRLLRSRGGS